VSDSPVRPALASDLPAVRSLAWAAYEKYLPRMDRPPAPMREDYGVLIGGGTLWVIGAPVVAMVTLTEDGSTLHVDNLAAHPAVQGTGIGRQLLDYAEEAARERGISRLELYTNEVMTENYSLYGHFGYREIGRITEDGYRRVLMEKDL